jgi:endogenous inhibitor of DNA gyrase (YacG/DUF329 family)
MKCPICRKPVQLTDPFIPFCSERCKLIDLGNWSSGKYVISSPQRSSDEHSLASDAEIDEDD